MTEKPVLLHLLFGAEVGGCETCALAMIEHAPAVRHRVLVLGPDGPMAAAFRAAGAEVDFVPAAERSSNRKMMAAVERAAAGAAAAMAWHGLVRLPPLIRALNRAGVPAGVYGGNPAHTMPRWVDWKFELLHRLYPPAGPLPVYVCCSQYVADSFESSRYLRRFPRAVVPNGVALPAAGRHHSRPLDPSVPFVLGMVARLNAIKDHATLIRAFAAVHAKFPNAELRLAGDGELLVPLRALASELGVGGAVRFLGNVNDVYGEIAGWDLFVFATTENEGMGSAIAEAMMAGLPCLLTDIGPTRDFVGTGPRPAVKLVPPHDPTALADAIDALIPDAAARQALGATAFELAMERFHPVAFAAAYARHIGLPAPGGP